MDKKTRRGETPGRCNGERTGFCGEKNGFSLLHGWLAAVRRDFSDGIDFQYLEAVHEFYMPRPGEFVVGAEEDEKPVIIESIWRWIKKYRMSDIRAL